MRWILRSIGVIATLGIVTSWIIPGRRSIAWSIGVVLVIHWPLGGEEANVPRPLLSPAESGGDDKQCDDD